MRQQLEHMNRSDAPELGERDVPDPYYDDGFAKAYALIEAAADGLLTRI
jgi:protein-tyrosine-phosphatase